MRTLRPLAILAAAAFFLPTVVVADTFTYDLGITNTDITFSKGTLVAGDTVRIYGRVTNWGTKDISGYMTFYQSEQLIGNSQVVTVRPNASYDDVWVDFVVPKGSFNIRGEIKGTTPQDENPANDIALSPMFTPLADTDGDLIADTQDNCIDISNADQKDTDADGKGDVCDAYPNDATNTPPSSVVVTPPAVANTNSGSVGTNPPASLPSAAVKPTVTTPPKSVAKPATTVPSTVATAQASATTAVNALAVGVDGSVEGASTTLAVSSDATSDAIGVSGATSINDVSVSTARLSWNTYRFTVVGANSSQGFIAWQTSDGATGTGDIFTHVFHGSGSYTVGVTVTTLDGKTIQGPMLHLAISFFNIGNWKLWAALLAGAGIVGTIVWLLLRRGAKERE